jgi:pyrroline-5-carboxylate reductase
MTHGKRQRGDAPQRVLMIGCGRMGGALLTRWVGAGQYRFTVVSPSGTRRFPDTVRAVRGAKELDSDQFDLIVIAVKPQQIKDVIPAYVPFMDPHGSLLSLAAGFSAASLTDLLGPLPICRVMPNLPVAIGEGVSALYADVQLTQAHRRIIDALMKPTGTLLWVDSEDELDRVTAVAGSGPGYALEVARCWVQAGEAMGFSPAVARALVLGTLKGSVSLALESDATLATLRDGVTSKNGTTEAGLTALNGESQLEALFHQTLNAAYARAQELR